MITSQVVLEALTENLVKIRNELGPDWPRFRHELAPLRAGLADVTDRDALEKAVEPVWQVCRRYLFVKKLIHSTAQSQRQLPAGGEGRKNEMPVLEIVNRFQSLFDRLEEMERSEEGKDQPREDTSQSET
jgi:hypothetical protein